MKAGTRVFIKNLKSRPELNGTIAVVLEPTPEEEITLRTQGRIKVTGGMNPISLKPENLTEVDETKQPPIDWTLLDGPQKATSDILSTIRLRSVIGNLDRCDEFVRVLLRHLNHQGLPIPFGRYHADDANLRATLINNVTNHSVYFFRFDQIGHHFVVEIQEGRARLYQSFIRDQVFVPSLQQVMKLGFTAKEWISTQPAPHWPDELKTIHNKYGGGRELSHLQFIELLDTVKEIQHAAKNIANHYEEILPPWLAEAESRWDKKVRTMAARNQACEENQPVAAWANHCFYHPWMTSVLVGVDGTVLVASNEAYDQSPEFTLRFPSELATPFRQALKKLHGMEPSPVNYIMLFRFRCWEMLKGMDEYTKELVPVGWNFSAITVPH